MPVIDARKGEVFYAMYRQVPGGLQQVVAPRVPDRSHELVADLLARSQEALCVGDGVDSIRRDGLRAGSYGTPNGTLTPLQAQIDLALAPNRGLRGALLRIDLAGLRRAGYEIPEVTQIGRSFRGPGGDFEMLFPYRIPPEFITVIRQ